MLMHDC